MTSRIVPVTAEWALLDATGHDAESHLLECSDGIIRPQGFDAVLTRYSPGVLERLPQVTVSWLSDKERQSYLAIAIHDAAENGSAVSRRRTMLSTSYFCVPYEQLAASAVSYHAMYNEFRKIRLPVADRAIINAKLAAQRPVLQFGVLAMEVAALSLTGQPVCILGAAGIDPAEGLRFLDAVPSSLPAG